MLLTWKGVWIGRPSLQALGAQNMYRVVEPWPLLQKDVQLFHQGGNGLPSSPDIWQRGIAGNRQGLGLQPAPGRSVADNHRHFAPVGEDLVLAICTLHHMGVYLHTVSREQTRGKEKGETVLYLQLLHREKLAGEG